MRKVRFCVFDHATQEAVEQALEGAGLSLCRLSEAEEGVPIVAFCAAGSEELLRFVRTNSRPPRRLIVVVGDGAASRCCWGMLEAGASDVVGWEGEGTARHIAARVERWAEVDAILGSSLVTDNLVGTSTGWTLALRDLVEAARFTHAPILLLGESGTGKELAARLVHALDPRADKRELVVVDCTTIVEELSGSEFFGHERGAFTGAAGVREGAFALADGGTLFLDEVGELPAALQAQLLRAVQEQCYKRVGGNTWHKTRFRLVCATHRDLTAGVQEGTFRRDLYYRLAGTICRLPSLAERTDDILRLATHFAKLLSADGRAPAMEPEVQNYLLGRAYPGNVRDLRQLIGRMLGRYSGVGPLTVGDIPMDERPVGEPAGAWRDGAFEDAVRRAVAMGAKLKDIGKTAEDLAVDAAIGCCQGSLQRAAAQLGVTDRALQIRRASRKALE